METINPEHIRAHVRFLSHDLLEGRGTGQRGGDIAAEYIATQFAVYGLKPAGDNGTYMQKVPMVGITPMPETTFSLVPASGSPTEPEGSRRLRRLRPDAAAAIRHRCAHRLRRLRHSRPRIQLGRLQRRRRERQSSAHAGERAAFRRRQFFQRQGTHLLRPLDLQVRRSRAPRGGGRPADSPDRHGQLPVGSGAQLELRERSRT